MEQGPDESARPGECPLCLEALPFPPEPRATGEVLAVLATHFAQACSAINFPLPSARAGPLLLA